jgi:hypothetical protein
MRRGRIGEGIALIDGRKNLTFSEETRGSEERSDMTHLFILTNIRVGGHRMVVAFSTAPCSWEPRRATCDVSLVERVSVNSLSKLWYDDVHESLVVVDGMSNEGGFTCYQFIRIIQAER